MHKTCDKDGFVFISSLGQKLGLKLFLGCCVCFCFNCVFSPAMEKAPDLKCWYSHKEQLGLVLPADKEVTETSALCSAFSNKSIFSLQVQSEFRAICFFRQQMFGQETCLPTSSSFRSIAESHLIKPDKCMHFIKKSTVGLQLQPDFG